MTHKQAGVFFRGTENRLKPAGIQVYFKKRNSSWKDFHFTRDSNGDLLLSPEFESIKDIDDVSGKKFDDHLFEHYPDEFDDSPWDEDLEEWEDLGDFDSDDAGNCDSDANSLTFESSSMGKALAEAPPTEGPINIFVTKPHSKRSSQTGQTKNLRAIERPVSREEQKLSPKLRQSSRVTKTVIESRSARRTPAKKPSGKVFGSDRIMKPQSMLSFPTSKDRSIKKAENEPMIDVDEDPFVGGSKSGTTSQSARLDSSQSPPMPGTRAGTRSQSAASDSSGGPSKSKTTAKKTCESKAEKQTHEIADTRASHILLRSFFQ